MPFQKVNGSYKLGNAVLVFIHVRLDLLDLVPKLSRLLLDVLRQVYLHLDHSVVEKLVLLVDLANRSLVILSESGFCPDRLLDKLQTLDHIANLVENLSFCDLDVLVDLPDLLK